MNGNLFAVFQQRLLSLEREVELEEERYNDLTQRGGASWLRTDILERIYDLNERKKVLQKSLDLIEKQNR